MFVIGVSARATSRTERPACTAPRRLEKWEMVMRCFRCAFVQAARASSFAHIEHAGQRTGPFFSGNGRSPVCASTWPILSSISSRVASITTGEHPIPARGTSSSSPAATLRGGARPAARDRREGRAGLTSGGPNQRSWVCRLRHSWMNVRPALPLPWSQEETATTWRRDLLRAGRLRFPL